MYLAWQIVPGTQLGDPFAATAFWNLYRSERDVVRLAFSNGFRYVYVYTLD